MDCELRNGPSCHTHSARHKEALMSTIHHYQNGVGEKTLYPFPIPVLHIISIKVGNITILVMYLVQNMVSLCRHDSSIEGL